jgi:beta-galactosidase
MPNTYREAMWGAYRGFFDNGIQADWVHIEDIGKYKTLYAPYPISMTTQTAQAIAEWVKTGGVLVSEATPGYFGDRGKVGTVQPHNGLDAVFGVKEDEVEFMPDLGDRISFTFNGKTIRGGGFLQSYTLDGATERGRFADGRLAIAEHSFGSGRTLLVGTHPGIAYFQKSEAASRTYFAQVLDWTGVKQRITLSDNRLQARLHEAGDRKVLWVLNPLREAAEVSVTVDGKAAQFGRSYWGKASGSSTVTVPPRDVVIVEV